MCLLFSKVWQAKDGQGGRSKEKYEWTSLRGHDRRVLLKKLPSKIPSLLTGTKGQAIKKIWEVHIQMLFSSHLIVGVSTGF